MIKLTRYTPEDWNKVRVLAVDENQLPFVGTIAQLFENVPAHWHFHVVTYEDQIVGFFNVDTGYSHEYDFSIPGELGLRAFFIDQHHQGKGLGKKVIQELHGYLKISYASFDTVCLTVNCKNPAAYRLYEQTGFVDTKELYQGGAAGPQHIMRMQLA